MADMKLMMTLTALDKASSKIKGLQVAAVALGAAAIAAGTKAVKAAAEQEFQESKLTAALKNVASASQTGAAELIAYAGEMQKVTTFGDEQIISAQAMLATFQLNEKQIKAITPRLLDMAAATQKTSGEQQDLQSIAIALGKGFTGQVGSLARYGVVLSDTAKASGDFNAILGDLDMNFKGVAEASAKTFGGQMSMLKNQMGDMWESVGKMLIPVLSEMGSMMASTVLPALKNMTTETGTVRFVTVGLIKIFQGMILIVQGVVTAFDLAGQAAAVLALALSGHFKEAKIGWQDMQKSAMDHGKALEDLTKKVFTTKDKEVAKVTQSEQAKVSAVVQASAQKAAIDDEALAADLIRIQAKKDAELAAAAAIKQADEDLLNSRVQQWQDVTGIQRALQIGLEGAFNASIDSMGQGWDKFGDGIKKAAGAMADSIRSSLVGSAAEWIASQATSAMAGAMKWIFSTIPFPWSLGVAAGAVGAVGAAFHNIKYMASGGVANGLTMVGEQGPELINVGSPSRVVPSMASAGLMGGGSSVNVYVTGNTIMGDKGVRSFADMVSNKIISDVRMVRNIG